MRKRTRKIVDAVVGGLLFVLIVLAVPALLVARGLRLAHERTSGADPATTYYISAAAIAGLGLAATVFLLLSVRWGGRKKKRGR